MKSTFILLFAMASTWLSAQTTFYKFSYSTLLLGDNTSAPAMKFRMPCSEYKEFFEFWVDRIDDVADDVNDYKTYFEATEVEIPRKSEVFYTVYTSCTDLHDSVEVLISFKDTTDFVTRGARHMSVLEAASKKWITATFVEFRKEELERREDLMNEARDEVEEAREDIADVEESIQEKQQEILQLKTKIDEARQSLNLVTDQIGQQRQSLARIELSNEEVRDAAEKEIKKLEKKQRKLQGDIRDWNDDIFSLEEDISSLKIENGENDVELNIATDQLTRTRSAYEELRIEIASYRIE